MTGRTTVPRGCVVCGSEHPDPHDEAAHAAHEERIRQSALQAAREELAAAGLDEHDIPELEQRALWGDR